MVRQNTSLHQYNHCTKGQQPPQRAAISSTTNYLLGTLIMSDVTMHSSGWEPGSWHNSVYVRAHLQDSTALREALHLPTEEVHVKHLWRRPKNKQMLFITHCNPTLVSWPSWNAWWKEQRCPAWRSFSGIINKQSFPNWFHQPVILSSSAHVVARWSQRTAVSFCFLCIITTSFSCQS